MDGCHRARRSDDKSHFCVGRGSDEGGPPCVFCIRILRIAEVKFAAWMKQKDVLILRLLAAYIWENSRYHFYCEMIHNKKWHLNGMERLVSPATWYSSLWNIAVVRNSIFFIAFDSVSLYECEVMSSWAVLCFRIWKNAQMYYWIFMRDTTWRTQC